MRVSLISGAIVLFSACASPPSAQRWSQPLDYLAALTGEYFPLASASMGSTYHIYVRYPDGYAENPTKRYPIVYLLDGDASFPMLAPAHLFLNYDDKIPEAIIVGIAYGSFKPPINHREVDFGTRAGDFQRFLADELLPRVESRTRADPARRILVGQSFGGTFVLYSAFTQPELFWTRIASNPSPRMHQSFLAGPPPTSGRKDLHLIIASGTANNAPGRKAAVEWSDRWSGLPTPWAVHRIDIPGGTHAADLPNAYRLGLRTVFPAGS
jgi:predicted alpha/beta superfamily hydrolase